MWELWNKDLRDYLLALVESVIFQQGPRRHILMFMHKYRNALIQLITVLGHDTVLEY